MAFEDLDLEFEDEEEAKNKKEAVDVDVDLEFHAESDKAPGGAAARPASPRPAASRPPAARPGAPRPAGAGAEVRPIGAARAGTPQPRPVRPGGTSPAVAGTSALKAEADYDVEGQEVLELREKMRQVEFTAEVKVAVAEYKTELLSELLGDMKLMEHQIGQLLVRINAKHPDMKQEVLMIKKILADFTSKKRK